MKTNEKLDLLSKDFKARKYSDVVKVIEENKDLQFEHITTEYQAEIAALAAFSYFNIKAFDRSLLYSLKLLSHLTQKEQVNEARDLYENLTILVIDCLLSQKKNVNAYRFMKRNLKSIINETDDLQHRFRKVKEDIAENATKKLNFFFIVAGFSIVTCQVLFHFTDAATYMIILIALILLILLTWKQATAIASLIKKIL